MEGLYVFFPESTGEIKPDVHLQRHQAQEQDCKVQNGFDAWCKLKKFSFSKGHAGAGDNFGDCFNEWVKKQEIGQKKERKSQRVSSKNGGVS